MPTYDYECGACGHTFEHFQSMNDAMLKKCPMCGKLKLHRLIGSGAGIIFKGSGFYETDYKRKSGSSANAESTLSSPVEKKAASTDSSVSTTKSAAKEGKPVTAKKTKD